MFSRASCVLFLRVENVIVFRSGVFCVTVKLSFGHSLKIILEQFAKLEPIPISLIHCLLLAVSLPLPIFSLNPCSFSG